MRVEFTNPTKRDAFMRCAGKCEGCGFKLRSGEAHYDHITPTWLSGDNSLSNCQVLCIKCHRVKTSNRDVPMIAKTKRQRDREQGIRKKSTFSCSKDSPWRKKLNGEVVPR